MSDAVQPRYTTTIGKYRIVRLLGGWKTGWAHGLAYQALDEGLDREVVIRTLSPESANDPGACACFRWSARVAGNLQHPNIVTVLDLGEHDGIRFSVSPAIDAEPLSVAMERGMTLRKGIVVVLQVLDAVAYMHDRGLVLRDPSPDGIFIGADGIACLTNFGATRVLESGSTRAPDSPAIASGSPIETRPDQFAVGCLLCHIVTGKLPFHGESELGTMYNVLHSEPNLKAIPSGSPWEGLRSVIRRALQKQPQDRYPDARAMQRDLCSALDHLGPLADGMSGLAGAKLEAN